MKRKLQFLSVVAFTAFMGTQTVNAQDVTGGVYNGFKTAGLTSSIIQFEDFDLGANQNSTTNPAGASPFGYSDTSVGNTAGNGTSFLNNDYRPGTDVDIASPATGVSVGEIAINPAGNEFLYYTVEFSDSGKYHIDLNGGHSNGTPRGVKFEILDAANLATVITSVTGSYVRTATSISSTAYATQALTDASNTTASTTLGNVVQFDVAAGTYVVKFTVINSGPNYNWFQIVRDGDATTLSADGFELNGTVNVYPNPSASGVFQLGEATKWEAYSILGSKVAQGEGAEVNLSTQVKGVYMIKTTKGTTKVVFQ